MALPAPLFLGRAIRRGRFDPREMWRVSYRWGLRPRRVSSLRSYWPRYLAGPLEAPGIVGASAPKKESAVKPGSVLDSHSSGIRVAAQLKRPTRKPMWATCSGR